MKSRNDLQRLKAGNRGLEFEVFIENILQYLHVQRIVVDNQDSTVFSHTPLPYDFADSIELESAI